MCFPPSLVVAGKSGTSSELRDSWFAGFSGSHVAVVWVGYDDNSPTGFTGSSGALTVWARLMANLDTDLEERADAGVAHERVDRVRERAACRGNCGDDLVTVVVPVGGRAAVEGGLRAGRHAFDGREGRRMAARSDSELMSPGAVRAGRSVDFCRIVVGDPRL